MNIIDTATVSGLPVTTTAIRRTATVAALILGIQVVAACGSEKPAADTIDPGASIVMVQGFAGSADALERRAAAKSSSQFGSADAVERRMAAGRPSHISADAAERAREGS